MAIPTVPPLSNSPRVPRLLTRVPAKAFICANCVAFTLPDSSSTTMMSVGFAVVTVSPVRESLDLEGRVAKLLLSLIGSHGATTDQGVELALKLTRAELGAMVGGSRQSVNQILHAFERRGYVERRGREVVVKDLDALRRRSSPASA